MRNISSVVIPLFQSFTLIMLLSRGDAPRCAQRLPLAIIFRAFGAPQSELQLFVQSLLIHPQITQMICVIVVPFAPGAQSLLLPRYFPCSPAC